MRRERVNLGAGSNPSWSPTTRPLSRRSHDPTFFHPYLRSLHRLKNLYRHFHSLRREDVNGDVAFFSLPLHSLSLSYSLSFSLSISLSRVGDDARDRRYGPVFRPRERKLLHPALLLVSHSFSFFSVFCHGCLEFETFKQIVGVAFWVTFFGLWLLVKEDS